MIVAAGIHESDHGNIAVPGGRRQLRRMVACKVALQTHLKPVIVGTEHVALSVIWTARAAWLRVSAIIGREAGSCPSLPSAPWHAFGPVVMTGSAIREIETRNRTVNRGGFTSCHVVRE